MKTAFVGKSSIFLADTFSNTDLVISTKVFLKIFIGKYTVFTKI